MNLVMSDVLPTKSLKCGRQWSLPRPYHSNSKYQEGPLTTLLAKEHQLVLSQGACEFRACHD